MKYPEYDSPFELVMSDITTQMSKQIDDMCWKAVQRVGINVDKDKLLIALRHDADRYREAYANGYDIGYEKRDNEIIRCKDCKWWDKKDDSPYGYCHACKHGYHSSNWEIGIYRIYKEDWFCADAERREEDECME